MKHPHLLALVANQMIKSRKAFTTYQIQEVLLRVDILGFF